jgi:hypothetical protein
MRWIARVIIMLSLCGGCTSTQLQQYALNQSLSVAEMRYQQVVNDLAKVAHNAGTLPEFALMAAGTANVTNTVSIDTGTLWDAAVRGFSKETLTPFGQHNPELQWTLDPAVSEPQLEALHYACLWALFGPPPLGSRPMELLRQPRLADIYTFTDVGSGRPTATEPPLPPPRSQAPPTSSTPVMEPSATPAPSPSSPSPSRLRPPNSSLLPAVLRPTALSASTRPGIAPEVVLSSWSAPATPPPLSLGRASRTPPFHLDVARQLATLPPGWLHITRGHGIPKHVSYKATCGDVTVWVTREGLAGLSQFTLTILDIATIDSKTLPISTPTASVEITEVKSGPTPTLLGSTAGSAKNGGLSASLQAIPSDQRASTLQPGNDPVKEGPKITETWDASQEFPGGNPLCTDPAYVQMLGKIVLSRPRNYAHMSWAMPDVEMVDARRDVAPSISSPFEIAPRSPAK